MKNGIVINDLEINSLMLVDIKKYNALDYIIVDNIIISIL
jgi:hypothetical protein